MGKKRYLFILILVFILLMILVFKVATAQELPRLKVAYIDVDTMIIYDSEPHSEMKGLLQWQMIYGNPIDTLYGGDSVMIMLNKAFPNEVRWTKILYFKDTLNLEGWVVSRIEDRVYLREKFDESQGKARIALPFLLYGETSGLAIVGVNNNVDLRLWGLIVVALIFFEGMFAFRWWGIKTEKYKLMTFVLMAITTVAVFGYAKITDLLVIFGIGK